MLDDSPYAKGLRANLIKVLRDKKITNEAVLEAINRVPRHTFLDSVFIEMSYEDQALQIGEGQTISQPYTVAYQSSLLDIKPRDKILEIGTGSGYQACVLAELGARVFTLERHKALFDKTSRHLIDMKYLQIKTFLKDGFEGLPTYAPFDKIIITCAAPNIPQTLIDQMAIGAMMIIPLEDNTGKQDMLRITKTSETVIVREIFEKFEFVPMLKGIV